MAPEIPITASEPLYVGNAGLVLTSPYLPHLFRTLDMTASGGGWKDAASAARAPHLLQWLADGAGTSSEPLLALNKILCGLSPAAPLDAHFESSQREQDICTQLLQAMIANWPVIGQSSVQALREAFLQREGNLLEEEDRWTLRVQRKALDALLDRLPWNFSSIRQAWMTKPLYVTW
jgi:hypothetical protein